MKRPLSVYFSLHGPTRKWGYPVNVYTYVLKVSCNGWVGRQVDGYIMDEWKDRQTGCTNQ